MKIFKKFAVAAMLASGLITAAQTTQSAPKHEFRGAWLHIIGQEQYAKMTPAETQAYLIDQLDALKQSGCNAIIWQVRPQADAAYKSSLEPWSRWISGKAGVAPSPEWDPLDFMVAQAHKRGMELHAWINPYRVTSSKNDKPAEGHIYYQHPEWFLKYDDGKIYFDPALPESRNFICTVVRDIMTRYDIDAIHMDDYFYPYPIEGKEFPDTASWKKYGAGWTNKGDWRRHNVDVLIYDLHKVMQQTKPWVRLGISPFGIWRNKKSDVNGSATNGLQCYDALYADCPAWTRAGWVDYMVPQLYWQLEHKAASDSVLIEWWNTQANGRHMYYGYAVRNSMDYADTQNPAVKSQIGRKVAMSRALPNVHGIVWWPGYDVTRNYKGAKDSLVNRIMPTKAIAPASTWIDSIAPAGVNGLTGKRSGKNVSLAWTAPASADPMQQARFFVIYRFAQGQKVDLGNAAAIVDVTDATSYTVTNAPRGRHTYVVTVLDRCNNESVLNTPVTVK